MDKSDKNSIGNTSEEYYLETALAGSCLVGMVVLFAQMRGIYLILFASLFTIFIFAMIRYVKSLVSRAKRAEEQLSDRLRSVEVATWRYDTENDDLVFNAGAKKLTGLSSKKLREDPDALMKMIHPDDLSEVVDERDRLLNGDVFETTMDYRIVKDEETTIWIRDLVTAIHDDQGDVTVLEGMLTDVTELKHLEDKIEYLSARDNLTDLLNRNGFYDLLSDSIKLHEETKSSLAVIVIDLDHFQMLNYELGPSTGDLYLRSIAKRLEEVIGSKNAIARFGGDEFIALVNETTQADVERLCKTLLNTVEETMTLEGNRVTTTASIGVSMYPEDSLDMEFLIKLSDEAMTIAKGGGRNCIEFISDHRRRPNRDIIEKRA